MTRLTLRSGPAHQASSVSDLLLRETNHRCGNDLQLVIGLLTLQGRRALNEETRAALSDAAERVSVLARARAAMARQQAPNLGAALAQVCEALRPYAEARLISIALQGGQRSTGFPAERIATLALVVNELMTNAIKHAFKEHASGSITVTINCGVSGGIVVTVDDDGLPYPKVPSLSGTGLGLGLARRLMASIDGILIEPSGTAKIFELRVPALSTPALA